MGQSILPWSLWAPAFYPAPTRYISKQPPEVGVCSGSRVVSSWLTGLSWIGKLQGKMGFPEDLEAQDHPSQIKAEGRHSLVPVPLFLFFRKPSLQV